MRDPKSLEELRCTVAPGIRHVGAHAQVREQGVLLEDEADAPLLRPPGDPLLRVQPDLVAENDPAAGRTRQAGDHAQYGRLARPGGPDERDGALDVERERQLEVAKRKREVEAEGSHLRVTRRAALITTSSALTASATSKFTSSSA